MAGRNNPPTAAPASNNPRRRDEGGENRKEPDNHMDHEKIRKAFASAGYPSLRSISKATNVDVRTIQRICKGESRPRVDTLERIFGAIGWEVEVNFKPGSKSAR